MLLRAAELARTAGDQVALCDALGSLAISYFCQDDPRAMRGPLEETLSVAESIGYDDDIRWCLWCLAHTDFAAGELASARAHGERALAMMPGQDPLSRYCAVEVLSLLDASMGAADAARERAEADLEQSRQEGLLLGTGALMHALGVAARAAGDLDQAAQWATGLYEQEPSPIPAWHAQEILVAVALARDDSAQRLLPPPPWRGQAIAHLGLARALLLDGDDQRAESIAHDALKYSRTTDGVPRSSTPSTSWPRSPCSSASTSGPSGAAARTQRGVLGLAAFPRPPPSRAPTRRDGAEPRRLPGRSPAVARRGRRQSSRGRGEHASAAHGWASLSPVERQVVELASHGLNNPNIARELFISRNTVKAHLSHAYGKLGVTNRIELARLAARHSRDASRWEVIPTWVMFSTAPSSVSLSR